MNKLSLYKYIFLMLIILMFSTSCEDEFRSFPTINYVTCDDTNVITNPNIITDFECQANVDLANVETLRNPSETPLNTSRFVGMFTDTTRATDFMEIDFGVPIDLSTNTVFKIKVKTEITGELRVMLDGGTSNPVFISQEVIGDNGWAIYNFDFSWRQGENHTTLKLFFNYGVEIIGGTPNVYFIDDLFFDVFIDPCQNILQDFNILSDFECQQNYNLLDDGTDVPRVNNPNPNAINNSIFVGEYPDDGTNGNDALNIDLGTPFDLTDNPQLHIKVNSTLAGSLLARLEGGAVPTEISNTITTSGEWINYVFDFSTTGNDHTSLLLYFNEGQTNGTIADVYYIDELRFLPAPCDEPLIENCTGVTPNFNIISDWNCQQNYGVEATVPIVSNPIISCENRSVSVGEYTDDGTQPFDAFILNYGTVIDLTTFNKLKFKIYSPTSIQVLAKLEGGSAIEKFSDFSAVNTWQEFTYDFSDAIANGNTTLVLFFNPNVTTGTPNDKYLIDELRWEED